MDPERDGHAYGFDEFTQDCNYDKYRQLKGYGAIPNDAGNWGQIDDVTPPGESSLFWHARQVIARIEHQLENSIDPFFIHWHMVEPHLPCQPGQAFADMYDPEDIEPWPGWHDDLKDKPWIQRQMPVSWELENKTWKDWAPMVARYFAVISELDAAVGELMSALDRLNISRNTLVVYSADHGDMCGSHHMIDKHNIMYDDVTRVPLLMRWPGVIPAGHHSDAFVSNAVDLATTFCVVAGAEIPESFQGINLLPAACGNDDLGRTDIYGSFSGNQFGSFSQRMLRDKRWKYVWNACCEDELYDLENDPGECINIVDKLDVQEELARLRLRLADWMKTVNDKLFNSFTRKQFENNRILGS